MNNDSATYSEAETVRRREAALKRMLNTPHQPHKKAADEKRKRKPTTRRSQAKRG